MRQIFWGRGDVAPSPRSPASSGDGKKTQRTASAPIENCLIRGGAVGSNLGPNTDKLGPKPCTMTQHKARRTNQIAFLPLPWAQEVPGSNPGAPTKNISRVFFYLLKAPFTSNPVC